MSQNDLTVLSTNKFMGFPDGNILSWCPKMDLLAVSMNKTSIWVFRLNGDRVYSINNRSQIVHLGWNASGKFFVVSGTDNLVKVYDSNSGKLVNNFATSVGLPITLTSWCSMDTERYVSQQKSPFQDLFKVDVLKHMPKLSNEVDSFFTESGIVSTVSSVQSLSVSVTSTNENEALLDYMLVINANALMTTTFNNLFIVSDIELPENCKYLKHATTEDLFTQYFLVEDAENQLELRQLRLSVTEGKARIRMIEIIRFCSQIVSILNHINDQLGQIVNEAKEFIAVYDRHLSNFKDSLYADVDLTTNMPYPHEVEDKIVDTLTDNLLTGIIPTSLKDYWLNQFGERGATKVLNAGNSAYDSARKTLFTQIILALEKLIIILSSLEAIAKTTLNAQMGTFGMELSSIEASVEFSQELLKLVYAFIWKVNAEQENFNKFIDWCKVEIIEKLSKEDSDIESFFAAHPAMSFKVSDVLEYFNHQLLDPVFLRYLRVDVSANEVLVQGEERSMDIHTSIEKLQEELNNNLLNGIQDYIASEVKFTKSTKVPVSPNQTMCNLSVFSNAMYVSSVRDSHLSIVKLDSEESKMEIVFPGFVIAYELITEDRILVLHLTDEQHSRLDLLSLCGAKQLQPYDQLQQIKSLRFDETTYVKHPAYLTINGTSDPSHIIGCVLDSSKQYYMVFKL